MKTSRPSNPTFESSGAGGPARTAEPEPRTGWGRAVRLGEDTALAALLGAMIVLSAAQILLRNVAHTAMPWIDPLLRALVLWVGLAAAVVAARSDRHISVDILSRFLPQGASDAARAVTSLFTAGVAGVVAVYSGRFVWSEWEARTEAFAGVPTWFVQIVIPVAFAWICLHYLILFADHARALLGKKGQG